MLRVYLQKYITYYLITDKKSILMPPEKLYIFAKAIIEINKSDEYDSVGKEELNNEIDRLHTRD